MDSRTNRHANNDGQRSGVASPNRRRRQHGYWAGGRLRRGNLRRLLLSALLGGAAHGYELMGLMEEQAGGWWRPSSGSVYPLLRVLEAEGLTRGHDEDGRRIYELTDEGRAQVSDDGLSDLLGQPMAPQYPELQSAAEQVYAAACHVAVEGDSAQLEKATVIIRRTQQTLKLLAGEVREYRR